MSMFSDELLHSTQGHKRTSSLFIEMAPPDATPFLSLRPTRACQNNGMISLRDLYIKYCTEDPTETVFAEEVFGDLGFWEHLKECKWMEEPVKEWSHISDARRKSLAFKAVMQEVTTGKNPMPAARFVIEEPWKDKSNKDVKEDARASTNLAKEYARKDLKVLREKGLIPNV